MSKKNLLFLNLGWAALAVGTFVAGSALNNGSPGGSETILQSKSSTRPSDGNPSPAASVANAPVIAANGKIDSAALVRPMASSEVEACLRKGLASADPIERDLLIAQALSQVTRENVGALLPVIEGLKRNTDNVPIVKNFLMAWARVDGPAAVSYGRSLPKYYIGLEKELLSPGITGWAESDPQAALAYLEKAQLKKELLPALIQGVLLSDPDLAFALSIESESGYETLGKALRGNPEAQIAWADYALNAAKKNGNSTIETVLYQIGKETTDGRALTQWLTRHPESYYNVGYVAGTAVSAWARTDPLAAVEWVQASSDPRMATTLDDALRSWSRTDHDGAITWTMENLDNPNVKDALPLVFNNFAAFDPAEAADMFASLKPGMASSETAANIAQKWTMRDPDAALRWAESIPDESLQGPAIYSATRSWPNERIDDLDTWLGAAPQEERFDQAREYLARKIGFSDQYRALKIASAIVDEKRWESATVKAAQALMKKDPATVREWLPESGLPAAAQFKIRAEDPEL